MILKELETLGLLPLHMQSHTHNITHTSFTCPHTHTSHAHTHARSFSQETVQPAFLKPNHPLPPTPSLTLLLPRLQAVAPQDGQARSGPGHLTWMTTQSDEEPLPILPGNRERSSTTKASDTSLSGYVRRCGRKGQPPTMRYVVTGVSCMPPPACLHITILLVEVSNLRVRSKLLLMFELHVFTQP